MDNAETYRCGHPRTPENSYGRTSRAGYTRCKICTKAAAKDYQRRKKTGDIKPNYNANLDTCPKGHPYDAENTYLHSKTGWRQCKACRRERSPKLYRHWKLQNVYGMSPEEYSDLLVSQDGFCAVCYQAPATQVDHDHKTGKVRGILCGRCNKALGMVDDDPDVLRDAADYLTGRDRHAPDGLQGR